MKTIIKKIWNNRTLSNLCLIFAWTDFVWMLYYYHIDYLKGTILNGFMAVFMLLLSNRTKRSK